MSIYPRFQTDLMLKQHKFTKGDKECLTKELEAIPKVCAFSNLHSKSKAVPNSTKLEEDTNREMKNTQGDQEKQVGMI
ncbi:MAG: hypothetical protein JSC189_000065 [Candidatus Tokpelaia sp. JSC189]|nr:MAG: hypothetical protein JSC189_000065 [Candidatus Tokpelaia sp. JSC189]